MADIHQILKEHWGYSQFRPLQEEIVTSVLNGNDTLALLPTGGGKSVCYQVPALARPGICLVISPLIALMRDQEQELRSKNIRAVAIVSGMKFKEVELALENCIHGDFKFLYVSPERLESQHFQDYFVQMNINLIAVDEAHCISQWGYDFRPPYLRIAKLREVFPKVPILALTASATDEVRKDICEKLELKNVAIFAKSFARQNISYVVRHTDNKNQLMLDVLKNVPGTNIVYVRNRRKTQEVAAFLNSKGIRADYYHAGLDQKSRQDKQLAWMNDNIRTIVATNAFGMGINKPNVRSVIHLDLPDDLESYYQEAGRAGRDEKPSYAVVLYADNDLSNLKQKIISNFPEEKEVKLTYKALGNYLQIPIGSGEGQSYEFDVIDFSTKYGFDPLRTYNCLKILEMEDLITVSDAVFLPARLKIVPNTTNLYEFQVAHKNFDAIIKALLRSYAGLFEFYAKINEKDLAAKLNVSAETVKQLLNQLHQLEIVSYLPATDKPQLTLNVGRLQNEYVRINHDSIQGRKKRFEIRANAMLNYISNAHECRSMMILTYFGEKNIQRCGTCDFCRDRNKTGLNDIELKELSEIILLKVSHSKLSIEEIADFFKTYNKEKVITVIRWLLDQEDLKENTLGILESSSIK
jgi:ATP-dependent DNA helicase RecQ